ncbi:MAG: hypothetical protein IJA55_03250 [Clostridia bacterium]|nr:hypothetical protein [Clostridia bacterium]
MFIEKVKEIVSKVNDLRKTKDNTLPDNSYFLDDGSVLCYPRKYGDSRYPYQTDGLVLFAHTNGYIDVTEGMFNVFRQAHYNEDTVIGFFGGIKKDDIYMPVSVTGAAQVYGDNFNRYTVFTPTAVYYITEAEDIIFAVRAYVDSDKHLRFTMGAINNGDKNEIYLTSFFEPMLRYIAAEGFFNRMTKYGKRFPNGSYIVKSLNMCMDCLSVRYKVTGTVTKEYHTTSKGDFIGYKGRCLSNAESLKNGCFEKCVPNTNTTELPIISDMLYFDLAKGESARVDYEMLVTDKELNAELFTMSAINIEDSDNALAEMAAKEPEIYNNLKLGFEGWDEERIGAGVINRFLEYVKRQVSLCALGKNYAGNMLGIRDVFQQLESSLMWDPAASRAQIVKVMNYILDDGRAPRQISFPTQEKPIPEFDLRPYIDQGPWIIETIYSYLAFTGDYSILDEECTYYHAEETFGPLSLSEIKSSILCHMVDIVNYLVSKIDPETFCLRALWGDWNDALDGLGHTKDEGKEFGSGVSVMATEQLYSALNKMIEILERVGKMPETLLTYTDIAQKLAKGYRENAITEESGVKRVLHGWGDKKEYYVGSYNDYDEKSRISLTAHAFAAISGLTEEYPELCKDIIANILSLDSKYGLLTFDQAFAEIDPRVGRISTITPGTYENNAAYAHASTFGIMALFIMGRSKEAWEQLEKTMVITHDNPTMTTFVMPNSYCYSEEYSIDGVSMGDWYTGSGTVLLKELVKYGFGIQPTLGMLYIKPPKYFPSEKAELEIKIDGKTLTFEIQGKGEKDRRIYFDGEDITWDDGLCVLDKLHLQDGMKFIIK